ncbi:thrombospondin-2 [Anabrus simplex]|uniref:thrombospondin-2 n=1 Tax=Anabrus simplex TaxID=316456 RepID=UPI0035A3D2CB
MSQSLGWEDWGEMRRTARLSDSSVDILRLLNVSAATPGVSLVVGPAPGLPAYKLRPSYGHVQVPSPSAITAALTSSAGFTLVFIYRQHRKSVGTLLSVHSPGRVSPWFQLTSNLRTSQLVLHYRLTSDAKLHQNSWSLVQPHVTAVSPEQRKAGGSGWTHISLALNTTTNMLHLHTDCLPGRDQPLAGNSPYARLHIPDDALVYFRQEPGFKKKFLGSMQVAKILPYPSRTHPDWSCEGVQPRSPARPASFTPRPNS